MKIFNKRTRVQFKLNGVLQIGYLFKYPTSKDGWMVECGNSSYTISLLESIERI